MAEVRDTDDGRTDGRTDGGRRTDDGRTAGALGLQTSNPPFRGGRCNTPSVSFDAVSPTQVGKVQHGWRRSGTRTTDGRTDGRDGRRTDDGRTAGALGLRTSNSRFAGGAATPLLYHSVSPKKMNKGYAPHHPGRGPLRSRASAAGRADGARVLRDRLARVAGACRSPGSLGVRTTGVRRGSARQVPSGGTAAAS